MQEIQEVLLEISKSQKESDIKFEKQKIENEKDFKKMRKELGWIGQSQEEVWIDLFKRNMKWMLRKRWISVDTVVTKFKNARKLEDGTFLQWKYDLMWINWKDIVVVEVKNKLRNEDINKFLNKQLPRFKTLFPQYKNYNLYWWIWWLIVTEEQEKQAERQWLFVFTQWKEWNAMIMNNKEFKAKIF